MTRKSWFKFIATVFTFAVVLGWVTYNNYTEWSEDVVSNRLPMARSIVTMDTLQFDEDRIEDLIVVTKIPEMLTGKASYYDFSIKPDGTTRPCFRTREWCWTQTQRVAATRDWPMGTELMVIADDGSKVIVTVQDYGPREDIFPERIIDLSSYAFSLLAPLSEGEIDVTVYKIN